MPTSRGGGMKDYRLRVGITLDCQWMRPPESTEERLRREQIQTRLSHLAAQVAERFQEMANEDDETLIEKMRALVARADAGGTRRPDR